VLCPPVPPAPLEVDVALAVEVADAGPEVDVEVDVDVALAVEVDVDVAAPPLPPVELVAGTPPEIPKIALHPATARGTAKAIVPGHRPRIVIRASS